ncbi:hypothetical protein PDESU_04737 [Pontiella desulfatans]|uniref:Uncharacterized protein n=1 Tax=Pontiella desulfatans TaxID=2750659 RepID=A0A6C2U8U9_PONDE|nr:hypothetical protein PDESU_04737 [Pontiella desulfatans]
MIVVALGLLLLFGCLIGWALGIGNIRHNQRILISQNDEIIERLDAAIEIQRDAATHQGIHSEPETLRVE